MIRSMRRLAASHSSGIELCLWLPTVWCATVRTNSVVRNIHRPSSVDIRPTSIRRALPRPTGHPSGDNEASIFLPIIFKNMCRYLRSFGQFMIILRIFGLPRVLSAGLPCTNDSVHVGTHHVSVSFLRLCAADTNWPFVRRINCPATFWS